MLKRMTLLVLATMLTACSAPVATTSSETVPAVSSTPTASAISESASVAGAAPSASTAEITPEQKAYDDYFAKEIQWEGAYLSGQEQPPLGSEAPYAPKETRPMGHGLCH